MVTQAFPLLTDLINLRLAVTLDKGGVGCILTKTAPGKVLTSFGICVVRAGTVSLLYRTAGSEDLEVSTWEVDISTGKRHRLDIIVDDLIAQLTVDVKTTQVIKLKGVVDDCGRATASCVTSLGGLAGGWKGTDQRLLQGCILQAAVATGDTTTTPTTTEAATTTPTTTVSATINDGRGNHAFTVQFAPLLAPGAELGQEGVGAEKRGAGYAFAGDGGLSVLSHPPNLNAEWSISLEVKQDKGTSGYLFAKTGPNGEARYYALYSSARQLTLYYTSSGKLFSVRFGTNINDGKHHTVLLSAAPNNKLTLLIDSRTPIEKELEGPVDDCGLRNVSTCIFQIGQREGKSGGVYRFQGEIAAVNVFPNKRWIDHPFVDTNKDGGDGDETQSSATSVVDWLDQSNHDRPSAGVRATGSGIIFSGRGGGLRVTSNSTAAAGKMSVAVHLAQVEGSRGYIFAKSSSNGGVRSWALYSKPNKVTLYYKVGEESKHRKVDFNVDLSDEREYRITFHFSKAVASLYVDDVRVGPPRPLNGEAVSDCGAASDSCVLLVGARSSASAEQGTFVFKGVMQSAHFYGGVAMSQFPV